MYKSWSYSLWANKKKNVYTLLLLGKMECPDATRRGIPIFFSERKDFKNKNLFFVFFSLQNSIRLCSSALQSINLNTPSRIHSEIVKHNTFFFRLRNCFTGGIKKKAERIFCWIIRELMDVISTLWYLFGKKIHERIEMTSKVKYISACALI